MAKRSFGKGIEILLNKFTNHLFYLLAIKSPFQKWKLQNPTGIGRPPMATAVCAAVVWYSDDRLTLRTKKLLQGSRSLSKSDSFEGL